MEKFSLKNKILIGVTLFSMFFGAGNLIFPPFLGAQAGTHTWSAFLGFAVSAVGLPILGVIAVTKSGGLEHLASRVHPGFSFVSEYTRNICKCKISGEIKLYIFLYDIRVQPCLQYPCDHCRNMGDFATACRDE